MMLNILMIYIWMLCLLGCLFLRRRARPQHHDIKMMMTTTICRAHRRRLPHHLLPTFIMPCTARARPPSKLLLRAAPVMHAIRVIRRMARPIERAYIYPEQGASAQLALT